MKLQSNCVYLSLSARARRTTLVIRSIGRVVSGLAFGFIVCLLAAGNAEAASFSFSKVVDTDTPIPDGTGNFTNFGTPALDNGSVAFIGSRIVAPISPFQPIRQPEVGIYTTVGGLLNVVADRNTPILTSTGSNVSFRNPTLDNGSVAFTVALNFDPFRPNERGNAIYTNVGGSLNLVAALGGLEDQPSLDNGSVAFARNFFGPGQHRPPQVSIYTTVGGSLNIVADNNTPIPAGIENFNFFGGVSLDNESVAFVGFRESAEPPQTGIYTNLGGSLNVVADRNTPIPGGTGNFTGFSNSSSALSLDNESVAFVGFSSQGTGIYTTLGGSLNVVADRNTSIPGGTGNFTGFVAPSLNNGNIAFSGFAGTSFRGIYTTLGGVLTKAIDIDDSLDGKSISSLSSGREGLSGNQIAFVANFTDNSRGIYIATLNPTSIPESSAPLGVLAIGACGALSLLQRKYKKASHAKNTECQLP